MLKNYKTMYRHSYNFIRKYSKFDENIMYLQVPVSYNTLSPVMSSILPLCNKQNNYTSFNDKITKYINKHNEDSFIIFHPSNIINKINQWSLLLPGVTPYYALKCNPDKRIIDIMNIHNINFDCASKNEIISVLSREIDSNRIIFANPSKMVNHIEYAEKNGISLLTFDSFEELYKIKKYHSNAQLLIRIKVDDSKSDLKFNAKFGADMNEVPMLLNTAKELKLNIVGLSFHVGSRCNESNMYSSALYTSKQVYNLAAKMGIRMSIINIGGGFPGINDYTFRNMSYCINNSIDKYFGNDNVEFIAEPGRYFVESSMTIVAKIINKKISDGKYIYYINEGVYGCFNNVLTDNAQIIINTFKPNENLKQSTVFGPSCDSLDCIIKDVELPELNIGDTIYVENMGAYTTACGTDFNGFKMAEIKYII